MNGPSPFAHLTPHQRECLDWLVQQITAGAPLLALRGLAGTGKTTLIPALREALEATGRRVVIGTPTHRAAMLLRQKGMRDANTIHAHALRPFFTPAYTEARAWLGEYPREGDEDNAFADAAMLACRGPNDPPPLIAKRLTALSGAPDPAALYELQKTYSASAILSSIGIHGRHHLIGFGPKPRSPGVLIVDEASMLGAQLLPLCQQAFRQVLLVGDPGQLAPVHDVPVLGDVAGIELTEIHRQAEGSGILRMAYHARRGIETWRHGIGGYAPEVTKADAVPARALLTSPLLTFTNATRERNTHLIRAALGYPPNLPVVGEPLVCKATDPAARADGFYNNALFRVARTTDHPRELVLAEEGTGEERCALVHLEEMDKDNVELDAIPFRFAYCLTAHTAQGGEWPTVYISQPELKANAWKCEREGQPEDARRWAYTAITRGRDHVVLLTDHTFLKEGA